VVSLVGCYKIFFHPKEKWLRLDSIELLYLDIGNVESCCPL
jgi:hypothetical protein